MIRFKNLTKTFKKNDVKALKNINLSIEKGDIFGFVGKSGAGKSTLLRMINGLELPTEGSIYVNNKDLNTLKKNGLVEARKKIGMIFQNFNLINSKSVYKNIAFPLEINNVKADEINKRVKEVLKLVDLEDKINAYPMQLSGGQKQRVAIARAIINNPSILLCDEATSALDPKTTKSILELLKKINENLKITIVLITHELKVVKSICKNVGILDQGNLIEAGNTENVFNLNKAHPITRELLEVEECIA